MQALNSAVEILDDRSVTGLAIPNIWLEKLLDYSADNNNSIIATRLENGTLIPMPWFFWPVPWGFDQEALFKLGLAKDTPVPGAWRKVQQEAGSKWLSPWIDTAAAFNSRLEWILTPVRNDNQLDEYSSTFLMPHRAARISRRLLALEKASTAKYCIPLAIYWKRFSRLLDNIAEPMAPPFEQDIHWRALEIAVNQNLFSEPMKNLALLSSEGRSLENDYMRLEPGEGGQISCYDKETGKSFKSAFKYVIESPAGQAGSAGLAHRISTDSKGLKMRVRIPVPGSYHGHRMPIKIWTTLQLDSKKPCIYVTTRFENLPEQHRISIIMPTGCSTRDVRSSSIFGSITHHFSASSTLWKVMGASLNLQDNIRSFTIDSDDWQSFRLNLDNERTLMLSLISPARNSMESVSDTLHCQICLNV